MEIPTPIFCPDGKDAKTGPYSERCKTIDCTVRRELGAAKDANVVLTVFHKLIYNSHMLNDFDVIIFDESHGLEDAVRNARLAKIRKRDLETVMRYAEDQAPFKKMIDTIQRISRAGRQEVNPMIVEREFVNPIKEMMPQIELKVWEIEESSHKPTSSVTEAYYTLARSVNSIDKLDSYKFVYHDESILGIPSEIIFSRRGGRQASKETALALISATIESPKFHARDCGLPFYMLAPPIQIESARLIAERFARRPIFGLVDGPIMRKDPNFKESYSSARNEANKIIADLVPKFSYPSLILCRSGDDARNIESYFRGVDSVARRVYLFEEEETKTDLDYVQRTINKKIDEGRDIIITTAASRLWEGVTINHLKLVIIDALPYASPQPYDRVEKNVWSSWRTSRTFRFMIRRMQQGVGRLVRSDDDPWGIVVVVDGRFNAQWNTIRTALPKYMTDPKIISFVTRESVVPSVMAKVAQFENNGKK